MKPIISVRNLGKQYRIGARQGPYRTLRETLMYTARAPLHWLRGQRTPDTNTIWALKDVSFDVQPGEVVGIIGRNGAGKSTLLKILSRITEPTEGEIHLHGRVGSLLEVGTGFHPELTGRENIYLNGTILGMRRSEIDRNFDAIVDFAGIEQFLDTPVKHYSSGMYMRLAFAVAAHLDTEILLVDEVLAVGDAAFQKRCLGKIGEVARRGRTVLFVSHNMASVKNLCRHGLMMDRGKLLTFANASDVISAYMARLETLDPFLTIVSTAPTKPQIEDLKLSPRVCNAGDYIAITVTISTPVLEEVGIEMEIRDEKGQPLIYISTAPMAGKLQVVRPSIPNVFTITLGPLPLATGDYHIGFWLIKPWKEEYHVIRDALTFTVAVSDIARSGFDFKQSYNRGAVTLPFRVEAL